MEADAGAVEMVTTRKDWRWTSKSFVRASFVRSYEASESAPIASI